MLPVPRPCSRGALFPVQQNNRRRALGRTSSQAGVGLCLQETIPGVLASCPLWAGPALQEHRHHPSPSFLGILGHTWLSPGRRRRQGLDGDLRGRQFLSTSDQITLPLTLIVGRGKESLSSTLQASWEPPGSWESGFPTPELCLGTFLTRTVSSTRVSILSASKKCWVQLGSPPSCLRLLSREENPHSKPMSPQG